MNIGSRFNLAGRSARLQPVLLSTLGPWIAAALIGFEITTPRPATARGSAPEPATPELAAPAPITPRLALIPQSQRTVFVLQAPSMVAWSEPQMSDRFAAAGLSHQIIAWPQVAALTDSQTAQASAPILLLPRLDVVTAAQLQTLQAFLQQGGRLVVGGPIGLASSNTIQQQLRSLLGAYWAFPLLQPAYVEARAATIPSSDAAIGGGVVVPHSADSEVMATWRDDSTASHYTPAAVVKTASVVFLGWSWGEASDPQVDSAWLQAAVLQYDDQFATGGPHHPTQAPETSATESGATGLDTVARNTLEPASADQRWEQATPSEQATSAQTSPMVASAPQPTALPIWPREANLMTQELKGLIGRFESALLLAESIAPAVNAQETSPAISTQDEVPALEARRENAVLVAAAEDISLADSQADWPRIAEVTGEGNSGRVETVAQGYSILEQAQRVLDEFPQLVAQRNYAEARRTWFEARRRLWDNFPSDRPVAQPEIRAIWLDRGTIVNAGSHQQLAQIFDRFAQAGINTVFFETVNAGYPVYPSRVAPEQNPLIPEGWDPLASAVELAHARNMELHAWVWVFAAGNQRHNTLVDKPWDYLGPVLERHPQWANLDHQGNPIPQGQTKPFFDPANPHLRRYLLRLFGEILTRYEVDGLQLDYIRYPFQDPSAGRSYGYGAAARRRFKAQTGVDPATISPSDRALWEQWTEFRVAQVDSFVSAVSRLVRRRRPDAVLSAAVFPMPEHDRRHKIQQLWERWARNGEVDIIATMSYAIDTPQLESLVNPWLNESLAPALVLPAIRLLNLPNTQALDQIQALRDLPAGGYALFAAENLNENVALQQVFQRTQGGGGTIPHRQPFMAASERYAVLKREWDVALSSGRLYISEQQETELTERAIALEERLQKLADNPSERNVRRAKRELDGFRQEFRQWMTLQSINGRYRVRTWENRLTAINNLLAYGEKRLER